ncbi:tyrosine-type recombinase/integrase [Desulfovibrio aminophilus]|uniref:integrase n=1 Tax=Desulfovibrio aminophilus TaxID=81425 RepID=UPI0033954286
MASIRKRGPRQWEVRIRKKGYPVQSKTFETKVTADAWARMVESEMDRGIFVSREEAESTTLKSALDRYIREYAPRLSDPKREENRAQAIQRRSLSSKVLANIRGGDLSDFIKEREAEGVSGNTIRLDLALLSKLFELARKDWGMESLSNPVRNVSKPKTSNGRTRRLEGDEEKRLLEECSGVFREVVRFALETAMRRTEIASLIWSDVDLKRRFVHLPQTKNGESRSVPLSPDAVAILAGLPRNISGIVFGMSPEQITTSMVQARRAAGIKDFRFHDLRHEATSRFFENTDLDVMEIKAITGHKSMQMLARYSHLRACKLADRLAGRRRGK